MQELKIIDNFFIEEDLNNIKRYCEDILDSNNSLIPARGTWDPILLNSVKSDVLKYEITKTMDSEIYELIYNTALEKFNIDPEYILFHYFLPESNIQWHNDFNKKAGATIYLNRHWKKENGGFFLYQKNNEQINIVPPKYNTCVFQTGGIDHCTTPTFLHSPIRKSIQVFF
jgi:CRISPR/Cas system-associated endonuclease/helicase Cas3